MFVEKAQTQLLSASSFKFRGKGGKIMAKKRAMKEDARAYAGAAVPAPMPITNAKEQAVVVDRKDFNPLCTFESKMTDEKGISKFEFNVKDNLTRYR
jgi:hypothetical protein